MTTRRAILLALVLSLASVASPASALPGCTLIGNLIQLVTGSKSGRLAGRYNIDLANPLGKGGEGSAFVGTAPEAITLSNGRTLPLGSAVVSFVTGFRGGI